MTLPPPLPGRKSFSDRVATGLFSLVVEHGKTKDALNEAIRQRDAAILACRLAHAYLTTPRSLDNAILQHPRVVEALGRAIAGAEAPTETP